MEKRNIKSKINDLKALNPKEFWKWPIEVKFGIGVLFGIGVFILVNMATTLPEYSAYQNNVTKEEKLKKEFTEKAKQSVNLRSYKEQLEEIISASDALLKQLPNKAEVEKLIIDINQSGISRGLRFNLFKPEPEKINDYYAELPIQIEVTGNYESIGNFASDLSQLSRVVLLKDLMITANADGNIKMKAVAKTFRYLDQEELENQKKELRAKSSKSKGRKAKSEDKKEAI